MNELWPIKVFPPIYDSYFPQQWIERVVVCLVIFFILHRVTQGSLAQ